MAAVPNDRVRSICRRVLAALSDRAGYQMTIVSAAKVGDSDGTVVRLAPVDDTKEVTTHAWMAIGDLYPLYASSVVHNAVTGQAEAQLLVPSVEEEFQLACAHVRAQKGLVLLRTTAFALECLAAGAFVAGLGATLLI